MTFFTKDGTGRITTSCFFLDGELIELMLSEGTLSDRGRAYEAVRDQTDHCTFPAHWITQRAVEISEAVGVQYHNGLFTRAHVTETTLEDAIIQLVNAMLLFYGVIIGACRIKETLVS